MAQILVQQHQSTSDAQIIANLKSRHIGFTPQSNAMVFKKEDGTAFGEPFMLPTTVGPGMGRRITQAAHGFSVRQLVRFNGSSWELAQASESGESYATHMVVQVRTVDIFDVASHGAWSLGGVYTGKLYLGDTPGPIVTVPPTAGSPQLVGHGDGATIYLSIALPLDTSVDTWQEPVISTGLTNLPSGTIGTPGDRYVVAKTGLAGGSNLLIGHENEVVYWDASDSTWKFQTPSNGWTVYDSTLVKFYTYDASLDEWVVPSPFGALNADSVVTTDTTAAPTTDSGLTVTRSAGVVNELRVGSNTSAGGFVLNGPAATAGRDISFRTAGVNRWIIRADEQAELGSDVGTAFQILARTDAGAIIDAPIALSRASGSVVTIGGITNRPTNFTGEIRIGNTQVISAGRAGTFASVTTDSVVAASSAGLLVEAAGGTDVVRFGAGGGSGTTFYGQINGTTMQLSGLTAGQLPTIGTSGLLQSDAGLTYTQTSSVTMTVTVGDGVTAAQAGFAASAASGQRKLVAFQTGGTSRWRVGSENDAESGSNAGSSFYIEAVTDAGAAIDKPISIVRAAGGAMTLTRPLSSSSSASFTSVTASGLTSGRVPLVSTAGLLSDSADHLWGTGAAGITLGRGSGSAARYLILDHGTATASGIGWKKGGVDHWYLATTGASDDLRLEAYTSGSLTDAPITIVRAAGGAISLTRPLTSTSTASFTSVTMSGLTSGRIPTVGTGGLLQTDAGLTYAQASGITVTMVLGDGSAASNAALAIRAPSARRRIIGFQTGTSDRWVLGAEATAESGANAGSSFVLEAYTDAAALIDTPISIVRASAGLITIGGSSTRTTNFTGAIQVGGSTVISAVRAATFTSVTASGLTSGQIPTIGTGGLIQSDAGLTYTQTSGVTRVLLVGDNSVLGNTAVTVRRTAGYFAGFLYQDTGASTRWSHTYDGTLDWVLTAYTAGAVAIDNPIAIVNASAGLITIGGSSNRPVNLTGDLRFGGTTRVTSAGAATFTSVTASGLTSGRIATVGTSGLLQDDSGLLYSQLSGSTINITVGSGAATSTVACIVNGASAQTKALIFSTAGSQRWRVTTNNAAEAGSNAGSAFTIEAYSDAAALIDTPISIVRAAGGAISFSRPLTSSSTASFTSITATGLTSGRVPYVSTGGLLADSSALTWDNAGVALKVGAGGSAAFIGVNGAAGSSRDFFLQTNGTTRWTVRANATAETGSNAGSNLEIIARDDAGTTIDTPISIVRAAGGAISLVRPVTSSSTASFTSITATGLTSGRLPTIGTGGLLQDDAGLTYTQTSSVTTSVVLGSGSSAADVFFSVNGAAARRRYIRFRTNAVDRWVIQCNETTESGSNAGSDFQLAAYTDAGALVDVPIAIARVSAGVITLGGTSSRRTDLTGALSFSGTTRIANNGDATLNNVTVNGSTITFGGVAMTAPSLAGSILTADSVYIQRIQGFGYTPPVSPATGERWAVDNGPSGAWTGQAGKVATWNGSSWTFTTFSVGTVFTVTNPANNAQSNVLSQQNGYFSGLTFSTRPVLGAAGLDVNGVVLLASTDVSNALTSSTGGTNAGFQAQTGGMFAIGTDCWITRASASVVRVSSNGTTGAADLDVRGNLQTGGTTRISSAGAGTFASVTITGATQFQVPYIQSGGGTITSSSSFTFSGTLLTVSTAMAATGAQYRGVATRTGSASTGSGDFYVRYTGAGSHTETLPAATGTGRVLIFDNAGSGNWTIDGNASETINGNLTQVLSAGTSFTIIDAATGVWRII